MSQRPPFPLAWPEGWARTPARNRTRSRFKVRLASAVATIHDELRQMPGVSGAVITSNLPVSSKGLPYATGRIHGEDPGIAVWWRTFKIGEASREQVIACDTYRTADENMQALAKSIEALRGLTRWGATAIVERAFAGFAALPPGTVEAPPWRVVFGITDHPPTNPDELFDRVKRLYHATVREVHPDLHPDDGGDREAFERLTVAFDAARAELQPWTVKGLGA